MTKREIKAEIGDMVTVCIIDHCKREISRNQELKEVLPFKVRVYGQYFGENEDYWFIRQIEDVKESGTHSPDDVVFQVIKGTVCEIKYFKELETE